MNNFPAMTEVQRQELIADCKINISNLKESLRCAELNGWKQAAAESMSRLLRQEIALAQLTSPPAPVLRVPDGWKLVPMVPTEAMIMAAQDSEDVLFDKDDDSFFIVDHKEIYRAMLENAPEASNEQ
ncbi:hypothetical protein RN053_21215 [Pantoea dispersa]|uniref:hypothetical protein n=1 Tax=Pantoea dispersa TaxID=59814 RepID=UPI0028E08326|nr:hypothetical protein [Pantoea dispersa]MDT8853031.1 hypothetical protein [Pantoea dispersa]